MPQKFTNISAFKGYRSKTDQTKLDGGFLVSGSKNVVMTDEETIATRQGYTLFGAADATLNPIVASYEWLTHRGTEHPLRAYNNTLEYYDTNDEAWVELLPDVSFTADDFNFAEWWDTNEAQDELLFVNGTSNIFSWSGGTTTFASATANTITKEGSTTWAEEGFLTTGTRKVVIEGTTYTYTGGESTTTLTGVTPDPTVAGHAVGASVAQWVKTTANSAISGLPNAFENAIIQTLDNQVYVGAFNSREVYISSNTDITDFTFSSPRIPGEGAILTFDATPVGFIVQENVMYVTCGKNFWYTVQLVSSDDLVNESIFVERLKTGTQQAAITQAAIEKMKNYIVFISNEPTLDSLGRLENINTPHAKNISDPIKNDFDEYDFTGSHVKYFQNDLYIAVPRESLLLVYNLESGFWEAPWIMPAGRLMVYGGELYLHSNSTPETYKLFQGYNDNGNAYEAVARFAYQNFGERANLKTHNEWYTEGYITTNTELTRRLFYDYKGFTATLTSLITGDTTNNYVFEDKSKAELGKQPLGKQKFGGTASGFDLNKFRVIDEMERSDYYEIQPEYTTNGVDQRWELLAIGANVELSPIDNNFIKQG